MAMNKTERKKHWDNIYRQKKLDEVSWYQDEPRTSLDIIEELGIPLTASIIDIGAGESYLPDYLIRAGYTQVAALDISENAIQKAKDRLGDLSDRVNYIISDITDFKPRRQYDLWHDRAVLHFLTTDEQVRKYVSIIQRSINPGGHVIIGVFSTDGPTKCSGIEIRQYDEASMNALLGEDFTLVDTFRTDHHTPFNTSQNFIFGVFRKG